MPICTSCGTVPIYNPKLRISQCTLCDGPPVFMGDNANTFELLPPMHRQKGHIVNVEIPYATKVLMQELSAITNITLRLITSGDTATLRPFPPPPEGTRIIRELKQLELPEMVVGAQIEEEPKDEVQNTLEQLAAFGLEAAVARQAELAKAADQQEVIDEEAMVTEIPLGGVAPSAAEEVTPNKLSSEAIARLRVILSEGSEPLAPIGEGPLPEIGEVAPAKVIPGPLANLPPTIAVEQPAAPVFVVPTDDQAMAGEGLPPLSASQGTLRRATVRPANSSNLSVVQASSAPSATGPILVNKLGAE